MISTEYRITRVDGVRNVYSGDVSRFISGDRKSIEIGKIITRQNIPYNDILYIGRGEAGVKTFSAVNSLAFNPTRNIMPVSNITLYGSSLESLLVLFNQDESLNRVLFSQPAEEYLPSLVVYSEKKEKSAELIDIECEHLRFQANIIAQRIEDSGESYKSVERDLEVAFSSSAIDIKEVREIIHRRLRTYLDHPDEFVRKIYQIAKARYKTFYADHQEKRPANNVK